MWELAGPRTSVLACPLCQKPAEMLDPLPVRGKIRLFVHGPNVGGGSGGQIRLRAPCLD